MLTGVRENLRNRPHMMTGVQEEIPYCSPGTSSGEQKKARSKSQPHCRSANALRQFKLTRFCRPSSNWRRTVVQPISITPSKEPRNCPNPSQTTMPTFDGKSEKFELFEDPFQTSSIIHNQLTEEDKLNYFHFLMRGDALQTIEKITSPNRENLGEILTVFRRKYVKLQSMATSKHKFQRSVFNRADQKLIDFLDELQKPTKDAFGVAAQDIREQFIYAKIPPPSWRNHIAKRIWRTARIKDCVASWKGVGAKWFGSPRWNAAKYCDATNHTIKLWKAQTNLPPL